MNIVSSCDENYAPYLAVMVKSVMETNRSQTINFYILDLGIAPISKDYIYKMAKESGHNLSFIKVESEQFKHLPLNISHISLATYARFLIAHYLSQESKALYLDVDMLINGDLGDLYNTDIKDFYLGACYDAYVENIFNCGGGGGV